MSNATLANLSFTHVPCRELFTDFQQDIFSPEEMAELKTLQQQLDEMRKQHDSVNVLSPERIIEGHREKYRANPTTENLDEWKKSLATKDELKARHRMLRAHVNEALRDFSRKEIGPKLVAPLRRAATVLHDYCEMIERYEQGFAAEIGVHYEPSHTLSVGRAQVIRLRERAAQIETGAAVGDLDPRDVFSGVFKF